MEPGATKPSFSRRKRRRPLESAQEEGGIGRKQCLREEVKCLKNTKCAVSVFAKGDSSPDKGTSYNEVVHRLQSLGATISPNVHRRVAFLIATTEAISQGTQRVRKAIKFSIPIVSVDFITACETHGRRPEHYDDFILEVSMSIDGLAAAKKEQSRRVSFAAQEPRTIDLGCCCSCHDDGALSCPWCIEYHEATDI